MAARGRNHLDEGHFVMIYRGGNHLDGHFVMVPRGGNHPDEGHFVMVAREVITLMKVIL